MIPKETFNSIILWVILAILGFLTTSVMLNARTYVEDIALSVHTASGLSPISVRNRLSVIESKLESIEYSIGEKHDQTNLQLGEVREDLRTLIMRL